MCGIIYVNRKDTKPAYKAVLKRFRKQRGRGTDGFGYVAIKDNKVVSYKRSPSESEIIALLEQEDAPEILFHHRFPTSTPNIEESAHPLLIENTKLLAHSYLMVHNGVISNTEDLQGKHEEMGFQYTTEIKKGFTTAQGKEYVDDYDWNDSESILTETALVLEGHKTTIDAIGSAAVIGLQLRGDEVVGRFFFRNNRNPLMYSNNEHMTTITSEGFGTEVPTLYLYLLDEEGAYAAHPSKIFSPLSYKPYSGPGAWDSKTTRDASDDWDGYPRSVAQINAQVRAALPPAPAKAGFQTLLTAEEKAQRASAAAAEFDALTRFDTQSESSTDEYGLDEEDYEHEVGVTDFAKLNELLAFSTSVAFLGDKLIWQEYEKVMESREELEEAIRELDQYVNDANAFDDETAATRIEMDVYLTRIRKYESDLESEITRRETLKTRVVDEAVERATLPIGF